jgi:hypothetical protein
MEEEREAPLDELEAEYEEDDALGDAATGAPRTVPLGPSVIAS